MSIKEDFDRAYDDLFYEAYHYRADSNVIPTVGKKRSTEGIRVKDQRAYGKLHLIDTRLTQLRIQCEEAFREITEWKAAYERTK